MKTVMDIATHQLKLFGTLNFEEVLKAVYGVVDQLWSPSAVALLIWDDDMGVFNDTIFYGPKGSALEPLTEVFACKIERHPDLSGAPAGKIAKDDFPESYPSDIGVIYYVRLQSEERLTAIILLAGIGDCEPMLLAESLRSYDLPLAISNAWEVRELRRENERLRNRYEDLEAVNCDLEEKTRNLIHDLEVTTKLRYQGFQLQNALYEICSAVKDSLEIQQVLQNACERLGRLGNSRVIILRAIGSSENMCVYEYHDESTPSARDKFFLEPGKQFIEKVLTMNCQPCEFSDMNDAAARGFDAEYLRTFQFFSALLVPIVLREKTIGAIFIHDCKYGRAWSIEHSSIYSALANHLSVAIENADLHEEKRQQAVTDGLTGVSNRRNFNEVFHKEFERAKRYAEPLSLVVFDLDYLKKINDTYGHAVGDDAIKAIARVLSNSSRSVDLAARYGGEEFCLLLPNTLLEETVLIAERIRKLINEVEIEGPGQISASVGVANFPLHANDPDELFQKADEALYVAKRGGRNRVCVFDSPNGHPDITSVTDR